MTMSRAVYAFEPYNVGRWIIWSLFAMVLLAAPWVFKSNLAHSMLSQMGIAMIACLAYNLLLGQGGMLSFGHAVYTGLGGYLSHACLECGERRVSVLAGEPDSPGRRSGWVIFCLSAGLCHDPQVGHDLCHDHPRHG